MFEQGPSALSREATPVIGAIKELAQEVALIFKLCHSVERALSGLQPRAFRPALGSEHKSKRCLL